MGAKEMSWANKRWSKAKKRYLVNLIVEIPQHIVLPAESLKEIGEIAAFLKEKWKL